MKKSSIYACYEKIKQREISELKETVKRIDGEFHFTRRPIVMVNRNGFNPHPCDVCITAVVLCDDKLIIRGYEKDDATEETFNVDLNDIAYGHISFITDAIQDKGEPNLIKKAEFTLLGGEWVCIHINEHDGSWEYAQDENDGETYSEGMFETDWENGRPRTVTGYDGCYDLPRAVKLALRRCGFVLEL